MLPTKVPYTRPKESPLKTAADIRARLTEARPEYARASAAADGYSGNNPGRQERMDLTARLLQREIAWLERILPGYEQAESEGR